MKFFKNITSKVIIIYIALAVMNIAFITTIIFENQIDLISENTKLNGEKLVTTLISSLNKFSINNKNSKMFKTGSVSIIEQIDSLIKPLINDYAIFTESGSVEKSSSGFILPDSYIENGARAVSGRDFTGKNYYLTVDEKQSKLLFYIPLDHYFSSKSILFVSYNIANINKHLKDLYSQAIIIIIIISGFHFLFAVLLFRVVINPIHLLNIKSREISRGNLSARVNLNRTDELGELSESFDIMAVSIEDKVNTLHDQMNTITMANKQIELMAITDVLTGLYNRRFFFVRMEEEIERARRKKTDMGLIMIDIDLFKKFNDTYGHQTGDLVLKHVAMTIKDTCRSIDIVCRYGGEEIVVLAPECPKDKIQMMAERIRTAVETNRVSTVDGELSVTISLGATSLDSLLIEAVPHVANMLIYFSDTALYQAKKNGRNMVMVG